MSDQPKQSATDTFQVTISADHAVSLDGELRLPVEPDGMVLFAHGSGSSRLSPRNRSVARRLNAAGFATLLFDLLTPAEEVRDRLTRQLRFDLALLTRRLLAATDHINGWPETSGLPIGYFGASTGAAAALLAAAARPELVGAIVSRGGRPDLAAAHLSAVRAPTLLIVGGEDREVIMLNQSALALLPNGSAVAIVPGAGHLFEEPGALEQVAQLAVGWFARFLRWD